MKQQHANQSKHSRLRAVALVSLLVLMLLLLTGCMGQSQQTGEIDLSVLSHEVSFDLFSYINLPFSYLLSWLYSITGNYGLALIIFAILIKVLLFPIAAKSKKGMMKMTRLTPKVKALEAKYGDDKQKYQEEVNKLYKSEGASGCSGCLWSMLPLLLLIPIYSIIREPITWLMFHGNISPYHLGVVQKAVNGLVESGALSVSGSLNGAYWQVLTMPHIANHLDMLRNALVTLENDPLSSAMAANLTVINTRMLGVELATVPQLMFWQYFDVNGVWNSIGQFLLPLFSGGVNWFSMWLSQKLNGTVIVDQNGERDEEMAKQNAQTNQMMSLMMPLLSIWIGFSAPAGLSLYWITQGVLSVIQDYFLTKHYKKVYDAEDAIKQAQAAKEAAEEAERERIRAERRAQNPDGITENTSKKKLQERQRQEQAAKEAAYQARLQDGTPETVSDETRPFRRGRAYRPDRYNDTNDNKE